VGVAIEKWDAETAAVRLRNRRRLRIVLAVVVGILVLSMVADHLRGENPFSDDWSLFDGRRVRIVRVIDGESIVVRGELSEEVTTVQVLGIKSFTEAWDKSRAGAIESAFEGEIVTLHLGVTKTRDNRGRLLADVVMESGKPLGEELVGEGMTLADRDSASVFLSGIERAQSQARKKSLGVWKSIERK
jgi:endonuclease YncB( thermonuclease family)